MSDSYAPAKGDRISFTSISGIQLGIVDRVQSKYGETHRVISDKGVTYIVNDSDMEPVNG